jgi:RNA polymerase sigma-70 factor, ECF subfamily
LSVAEGQRAPVTLAPRSHPPSAPLPDTGSSVSPDHTGAREDGASLPARLRTRVPDSPPVHADYLLLVDEELMPLVAGHDARAFAVLYDRHSRLSYSLAYRMMGNKQAAEDVMQDAFIKVWNSAGTHRIGRGSVRTWILAVVRNRAIDQLRSRTRRDRLQEQVALQTPGHQPSEAFDEALRGTRRDRVRRAVGTLPPEQVEVLELAYFSGLSQTEISVRLGLPLGTVKSRTRSGLRKLKTYLAYRPDTVASG